MYDRSSSQNSYNYRSPQSYNTEYDNLGRGGSYRSAELNRYPGSPYRSGRPVDSSYDIYEAPGSAYGPKNGSERCIPKCFAEKGSRVSIITVQKYLRISTAC